MTPNSTTKTKTPPTNWRTVKLGDVCNIVAGGDSSKLDIQKVSSGVYRYPVFSNALKDKGLLGYASTYDFEPEAVTVTARGDVGFANYRREKFNAVVRLLVLKPKNNDNCLFISYYINSKMKFSVVGSGVNQLTVPQISDNYITLPPLPEQKAIARVLGAFDDKIELLRAQNKTLEQIGQTLFQEWFVKKTDKMIPATKVLNFERGVEVGSSNYFEKQKQGTVPFYRVADIKDINIANVSTFTHKDLLQGKTFSNNDILVSFDGTVGRVFVGGTGGYSSGMRKLTIKQEFRFYTKSFIYFWAKSSPVQEIINEHATGTTILHASKAIDFLTIQSSKDVIKKFDAVGSALFDKILLNTQQTQTLEKMRDTLLPKLMSGEVRVEG